MNKDLKEPQKDNAISGNLPTEIMEEQKTSENTDSTTWNKAKKTIEPLQEITPTITRNNASDFFGKLLSNFIAQQNQTIRLRAIITKWFAFITALQLLVVNVLIFFAIYANQEVMPMLLDFLKYFVGATFVELLGGLIIIVKFIFNHETSDMIKHLYVDPKKDETSKSK